MAKWQRERCWKCDELGHVCLAVTRDDEERPVCLDCLNERECVTVRVARELALANARLEKDAMGEPIEMGTEGNGPVRDVTPVDVSRVFYDKPPRPMPPDLIVPRMVEQSADPVRRERSAAAVRKMHREKTPVAVARARAQAECAKAMPAAEKVVEAKQEERKTEMEVTAKKCAFAGCELRAYGERLYCTQRHSYKNKKAPTQLVEIGAAKRGAADGVMEAMAKVDGKRAKRDAAVGAMMSQTVTVNLELSAAELDGLWARIPMERKVQILAPMLQAAILQQFAG